MPEITQAHILGQTKRLNALLNRMLRLTGYFSALAGVLFWVWDGRWHSFCTKVRMPGFIWKRWLLPCR